MFLSKRLFCPILAGTHTHTVTQVLDIINKIDDDSGYLDFKVEEISGNVQ